MLATRIGALFALLVFSTSTFAAPPVKFGVQVDLTGNGTVTSSPGGISCPMTCLAYFKQAATITLTAAPAAGETFLGWGGACSGTGSCTIPSIQGDVQVAAQFSSNGGGGGGGGMTMVPEGTEPNSLLYWNGVAWAELLPPAAEAGRFALEWVDGGLQWTGNSLLEIIDIDAIINATTDSTGATFNSGSTPIVVQLDAGRYRFTPLGPVDGGLFTAFIKCTCNPVWYWKFDYVASENSTRVSVGDGTGTTPYYQTAEEALSAQSPAEVTLESSGWIKFFIYDSPISDNAYGVSFKLEKIN